MTSMNEHYYGNIYRWSHRLCEMHSIWKKKVENNECNEGNLPLCFLRTPSPAVARPSPPLPPSRATWPGPSASTNKPKCFTGTPPIAAGCGISQSTGRSTSGSAQALYSVELCPDELSSAGSAWHGQSSCSEEGQGGDSHLGSACLSNPLLPLSLLPLLLSALSALSAFSPSSASCQTLPRPCVHA